jgi:DNA-directed RNA polymerase specialized sigma24 family protein
LVNDSLLRGSKTRVDRIAHSYVNRPGSDGTDFDDFSQEGWIAIWRCWDHLNPEIRALCRHALAAFEAAGFEGDFDPYVLAAVHNKMKDRAAHNRRTYPRPYDVFLSLEEAERELVTDAGLSV